MKRSDSSSKTALRECLASLDLPPGLLSSAYQSLQSCDSRLWLLDNSSRMKVRDSHVGRGGKEEGSIERVDDVTRWEELQECVAFHAKMASRCWIPTKYWLVNDPAKSAVKWQREPWQKHSRRFTLCWGSPKDIASEMSQIRHIMNNVTLDQPQCPLTSCIHSLSKGLAKEAPNLSARDRHVTLVICTQGLPTDSVGHSGSKVLRDFQHELSSFSKLPLKIIIRLCTDNEKVRDMFNTLDSKLGSIDVLDDFWGEAIEVYLHNPWLTYTMGLHRLRESGLAPKVMDNLDEEPLSLDEIHQLCTMLFLGRDGCVDLPHPRENWNNFFRVLTILVEKEKMQWNPVKKRPTPWINVKKLESMHGGGESSNYHRHHGHSINARQRQRRHTTHERQQRPPEQTRPSSRDPPTRQRRHTNTHSNNPQSQKQPHHRPSNQAAAPAPDPFPLTLPEVLQRWSHQPPTYKNTYSLQHILVTVPRTFPPMNTDVEPHEYFSKWKTLDPEAFADESGDELKELLKRAVRKAKFFLHPDKLPKDLTENQTLLFKTIWNVIQDGEAATLD